MFSLRADFFYGQARGLDAQYWTHSSQGGGLVEQEFSALANTGEAWFPSYKTQYAYGALQGVLNIGNILFTDFDVDEKLPRALKKYAGRQEKLTAEVIQRAINEGDKDAFYDALPQGVNKQFIWDIVSK